MPANTSSYDAWGCKLLVSPEQVYENSPVTFTVVLSHQSIGEINYDEHASIYENFDYQYFIGGLEVGKGPMRSLTLDRLPPSIRDGIHQASVRITPKNPDAAQTIQGKKLRTPPSDFSVVARGPAAAHRFAADVRPGALGCDPQPDCCDQLPALPKIHRSPAMSQ